MRVGCVNASSWFDLRNYQSWNGNEQLNIVSLGKLSNRKYLLCSQLFIWSLYFVTFPSDSDKLKINGKWHRIVVLVELANIASVMNVQQFHTPENVLNCFMLMMFEHRAESFSQSFSLDVNNSILVFRQRIEIQQIMW